MAAPIQTVAISPLESLNLGRTLFLVSSFVAPIEILLAKSFTAYDLLTTALFFLVLARGRVMLPSPAILCSGLVFLLFALLSTLRAPHPGQSLTQILQYLFILFVQLPVILFFTRSRFMIHASLVAFLLGSLVGIGDAFLFPQAIEAGRVGTFFSDSPNRLGYPAAYLSPFLCYLVLERWRESRGWVLPLLGGAVVAYLMLWALAASGSRGATAGTVIALSVFLAFRRGFSLRPSGLARVAAAVLTVALCGVLLYRSDHFPETLRMRIDRTLAAEDSLVQDRTTLAVAGMRAFRESPLLGVGLDNFRYVSDRYLPTITQQLPHNLWIQLLVHTGLFGTLGFLGMIVSWYGIMLRAQRCQAAAGHRELIWAFIASMSATMMIFLFVPVLIQRQYWWIFGLGLSVVQGRGARHAKGVSGTLRREALGL
jgi:O-antigen ligase